MSGSSFPTQKVNDGSKKNCNAQFGMNVEKFFKHNNQNWKNVSLPIFVQFTHTHEKEQMFRTYRFISVLWINF